MILSKDLQRFGKSGKIYSMEGSRGNNEYSGDEMQIKFWGVRGSFPQTLSTDELATQFQSLMQRFFVDGFKTSQDIGVFLSQQKRHDIGGYGGATTCVEIKDQNHTLIIDGGSGLKKMSDQLERQNLLRPGQEHHILLTHFHFDHVMGLPFFMPHFMKNQKVHYYCVQPECESIVRSLFQKPLFPVPFNRLSAEVNFHRLKPYEKNVVNGFEVTPYRTDHPDECYGFKIVKKGKTYSHAVDNEAQRVTAADLQKDAGLYEGSNLLYMDAQYSEEDMSGKKGWGHGTYERAFQLCQNFKIPKVLLGHHDPALSHEEINHLAHSAQNFIEKNPLLQKIDWEFVYEGQEVTI